MSNQPAPAPHHPAESKWRILALVLLPIVGILLVLLAIFLVRPRDAGVVTVVYTDGAPAGTTINTGDVIDATDPRAFIVPQVGYRYKVFISDESEDRASGVARLGGRVTFIPNGRRGQTAVVDLTRIGERVYEAVLVKVLSEVEMPPKAPPAPFAPPPAAPGEVAPGIFGGGRPPLVFGRTAAPAASVLDVAFPFCFPSFSAGEAPGRIGRTDPPGSAGGVPAAWPYAPADTNVATSPAANRVDLESVPILAILT